MSPVATITAVDSALSLLVSRSVHTATPLQDGRILIAGGVTQPFAQYARPVTSAVELYDPSLTGLVPTGSLLTARALHTATLLQNGLVLITGGEQDGTGSLASAELYDPAASGFRATGALATPRQGHTATRLSNGLVLITGGYDGIGGRIQSSAELYDPATGRFRATGNLTDARQLHTATLLPDGRVLVTGGFGDSGTLASAELYDPTLAAFTPAGSMTSPRLLHQATALPSGTVLLTGGSATIELGGAALASAELYDPASGTFRPVGPMGTPRNAHTATLLGDGRVLVAGGSPQIANLNALAAIDFYDPTTEQFTASPVPLVSARERHTATALADGQILFAGGHTTSNVRNAELYHLPAAQIAFNYPPTIPVGGYPGRIIAADFNGDRIMDAAVVNTGFGSDSVSILLGQPAGTFLALPAFYVDRAPGFITTGDANGDQIPDLVLTTSVPPSQLILFLGHGDGTFDAPRYIFHDTNLPAAALADVNGDNKADLLVIDRYVRSLFVFPGNGDGTFQASSSVLLNAEATALEVADLSGDGRLDVIVIYSTTPSAIGVLLGRGDGTFGTASNYTVANGATSVAIGDLDGNGLPDLAVSSQSSLATTPTSNGGGARLFYNTGGGLFQTTGNLVLGYAINQVAIQDVTGDQRPELLVGGNGIVSIYLAGTTSTPTFVASYAGGAYFAVGDYTGDGRPDIAATHGYTQGEVVLLPGHGDATFDGLSKLPTTPTPLAVTLADLDGNGLPDIAAASQYGYSSGYTADVYRTLGPSIYSGLAAYSVSSGTVAVASGDLDGDGRTDLLYANAYGDGLTLLRNTSGTGLFSFSNIVRMSTIPANALALGDLNADGRSDVVLTADSSSTVGVLLGQGGGRFQAQANYVADYGAINPVLADLNGDGRLDIVVAHQYSRSVGALLGDRNGSFQAARTSATPSNPYAIVVADLDGDGRPDVVATQNTATPTTSTCSSATATRTKFTSPRQAAM